ncbi:MAG: hypothetical protein M1820_001977 [Bogoriella megaspora]|nr:MAG: hypothetical protein M1820_001977 [Bogoriella megaspora]
MPPSSSSRSEEVNSALADSTYEVIDAQQLVSDEDIDVQSESLPSCGGNTTDCDISSVADTEEYVDNRLETSVNSLLEPGFPTPDASEELTAAEKHVDDSAATVRPLEDSRRTLIQFPEPTAYDKDGTDPGTALVNQEIFSTPAFDLSSDLEPSSRLNLVPVHLQMRISEYSFKQQGPFSVMLVGKLSGEQESALIHKIAAALAAGHTPNTSPLSAPTRLNVVSSPALRYGEQNVSVVENTGLELLIETCSATRRIHDREGIPHIFQARINGKWVPMNADTYAQSNKNTYLPHTPNIAVYVHDSSEDWIWDVEEVLYNRGVPAVHVSHELEWTLQNPTDDGLLEMIAKTPGGADAVSPVDLDTFLRLHNGQLGRHLAFLNSFDQGPSSKSDLSARFTAAFREIKCRTQDALTSSGPVFGTVKMIIVALISSLTWFAVMQFLLTSDSTKSPMGPASTLNSSLAKLTNSTTALSNPQLSSLLSIPPVPSDAERAAHSHLSEALKNGTEQFTAYPFAGHFIALKAPPLFASLKKAPELFVKANRSGKELEANMTRLVFEHYAVSLAPEQSYGSVNITIFTKSKPLITQSLTVELGPIWTKSVAVQAVVSKEVTKYMADAERIQSVASNFTSRWVGGLAMDAWRAKNGLQPAITKAVKAGTEVSLAAGAATWRTMDLACQSATKEISRIYQAISCKQTHVGHKTRGLAHTVSGRARIASDCKKAITALRPWVAEGKQVAVRRVTSLGTFMKHQNLATKRKANPMQSARNNAVQVWNRMMGRKPMTKSLGAFLDKGCSKKVEKKSRGVDFEMTCNF